MQATNFGGTFDQLFLCIFYEIFTEDASLRLLYHGAKKSKMTKNSNQGGPALIIQQVLRVTCKIKEKKKNTRTEQQSREAKDRNDSFLWNSAAHFS